jgi:hypothetical protein
MLTYFFVSCSMQAVSGFDSLRMELIVLPPSTVVLSIFSTVVLPPFLCGVGWTVIQSFTIAKKDRQQQISIAVLDILKKSDLVCEIALVFYRGFKAVNVNVTVSCNHFSPTPSKK